MKILLSNHWLKKLGGSETFTFTMAEELVRRKHDVELFTFVPGNVSKRINRIGVKNMSNTNYDLILANHHTTVNHVYHYGLTIQTCHGTIPKLEQPSDNADIYIPISEEIKTHLGNRMVGDVILNGINLDRFKPTKLNSKPKKILSLVHSDKANTIIQKACANLKIELIQIDKYKKQIWNIEEYIKEADIVISLGRGAYESFACGKPVIVFDARPYQPSYADGYIDASNIKESIKNNCSGRRFKKEFDPKELIAEIKKYNPKDGEFLRGWAEENHDIKKQVDKYLNYA